MVCQARHLPFILETGGRVNQAARDWLDTLTAPKPGEQVPSQLGRPPVESADADDHRDRPKGGDAGAAGPHADEDYGGCPLCRPRCRVGTVVVDRAVFYAGNALEFLCCTCLHTVHVPQGTYVRTDGRCTYVPYMVRTYHNVMSHLSDLKRAHMCMHQEPRAFWEDTRLPVERGSECRATHTSMLATAFTPLPQRRGLLRATTINVCEHVCLDTYTMVLQYRGSNVIQQLPDWKRATCCRAC
jgi:hypothetical protein